MAMVKKRLSMVWQVLLFLSVITPVVVIVYVFFFDGTKEFGSDFMENIEDIRGLFLDYTSDSSENFVDQNMDAVFRKD